MNLKTGIVAAFVALLLGAGVPVNADVVHLEGGDRVSGEIDSITGGKVILKTEFAGTIRVALDKVRHMESEKVFEIRTVDGQRLRGALAVSEDAQQLRDETGATADLEPARIASAAENRIGFTSLGSEWTNRFAAGITASTGNTETSAQNYLWESVLTRQRSDHKLDIAYNTQEDDDVKTREDLLAGYRYRRFFGERWYGLGNVGYQEDEFKGIDYRWTLGVGGGYEFWNDSQGALSTDLGFNYVIEKLDGETEESPAARWGLEWNRFIWAKQAELFYKHGVLFIFRNGNNTVYNGSTGVRFSLSERLTANLRVDVSHETDPAPDRDKTDLTYVIGVGLTL